MDMDSEQKYIEEIKFVVTAWFLDGLDDSGHDDITLKVVDAIDRISGNIPITGDRFDTIYGVVESKGIFYAVDYVHNGEDVPLMLFASVVDSDRYLDAINENKTIKNYESN